MHKKELFLLKNCKKSLRAGDFAPQTPLAFGGWELRPKTSNPPLRIPGYATAPHHSFNAEYQESRKYQLFKSFGRTRREKLSDR